MIKVSEKSQDALIKFGLLCLAYLIIAKPIFNFLGITKSKGDRIREKALSNPESPFKTDFWRRYYYPDKPNGIKIMVSRKNALLGNVVSLHDAFGYFTDDEDKISGIIYDLKSKAEVSIFAFYFFEKYKVDLLTYLGNGKDLMPQNGLGDYELNIILNYVASLKNA